MQYGTAPLCSACSKRIVMLSDAIVVFPSVYHRACYATRAQSPTSTSLVRTRSTEDAPEHLPALPAGSAGG